MKLKELNFKHNIFFLIILFSALTIELVTENLGLSGAFLPNSTMCVVFAFAYLRPIALWLVILGVIISESFFSTIPALMAFLIILGYYAITKLKTKGGFRQRNFGIIVFMLITLIIYSTKILWLFMQDLRPEVTLILIKMLVTIIFFPLFYMAIDNFLKRY